MKTILRTFGAALLVMSYFLFTAQYDNPGNGKTGAPGEGLCTECHTPENSNFEGFIQIDGLPDQVFPNTTYTLDISVNFTEGNPINAGLQLTVLDGANNLTGSLRNPKGLSGIVAANNRLYFEHKGGPTDFYEGTTATWAVDWISPETISDPNVRIYAAAILSNADTTAQGDKQLLIEKEATLIEGNAPLTIQLDELNQVSCAGARDGKIDLDIFGGVTPYDIRWSTEDSINRLTNIGPGTYSVTVTDSDTSMAVASYTITSPDTLILQTESTSGLDCSGTGNGSASLSINGGSPPYLISWPDGDTSLTRADLDVGSYLVLATDDGGCQDSTLVVIEASINVQANLVGIDESEPGANDGIAIVSPSGGTPPYLIVWSNGESALALGDTITGLSPQTIAVQVGDLSGCLISDTVVIARGVCDIDVNTMATSAACGGSEKGAARVDVNTSDGFTFLWSTGDTISELDNLDPGTYTVTVTNRDSCIDIDTVVISSSSMLELNIVSLGPATCNQGGNAGIVVTGGQQPYAISWSNGVNDTLLQSDLPGGIYRVTITDANDCVDSLALEVINIDNNPPNLNSRQVSIFADAAGQAVLTPEDVLPLVSDDCGVGDIVVADIVLSCVDMLAEVAIEVNDMGGNTLFDTLTVTLLDTTPPFAPDLNIISVIGCDTVLYDTPTILDNCQLDTIFQISGPSSGTRFPGGVTEIMYQAIDNSGNSSLIIQYIEVEVDLAYTFDVLDPSCTEDSTGAIMILSDTTLGYSFQWQDGTVGNQIERLSAGIYNVTISDSTGCTLNDSITLSGGGLFIVIDSIVNTSAGEDNGSIFATISGGTPPYTIAWLGEGNSFVSNEEDLVNRAAGQYAITVLDNAQCNTSVQNLVIGGSVSYQSIESQGIQIYPNPVDDRIRINNPRDVQIEEIKLFSVAGRKVRHIKGNHHHLAVGDLAPGLYLMTIKIGQEEYFERIVVR